ncbi:4Fe-4S binding protein [Oribacterium parvum]|uniref:4Fe-4S binding protein n=1 Tax=Oribacterium parvum TaxID=1501329 RepID=UPI0028ECF6D6|nr:4Fe-4S binding protein [Oribacterium parvum]
MDKLKEIINGKSKKDKYKARNNVRHVFQSFWFLLTNSFFEGFKTGKIYGGKWKQLCVPGMNCYSCPGAKGSCPIGALQAVIGSPKFKFSYYIVGFLFFVGALIGRGVCGYLCPFGLVQDLLHKIPFVKKIETFKGDKALRKAKYLILLVFVILLPLFLVDIIGQGAPYFCKLICPVGMMEGGIPLVLMNKSMRGAIGFLYAWKGLILILTIFLSIVIYRPFCKYICPLGAIYSLFNSVSLFRYTLDHQKCIHCGRCKAVCEMQCDPVKNCNDLECIRCGKCKNACPVDAIACGITKPEGL